MSASDTDSALTQSRRHSPHSRLTSQHVPRMPSVDFRLYLVTDRHQTAGRPLLSVLRQAVSAGGVRFNCVNVIFPFVPCRSWQATYSVSIAAGPTLHQ